jgi:hypothetical protein
MTDTRTEQFTRQIGRPSMTYTEFLEQCAAIRQDQQTCAALTSMLGASIGAASLDHIIGAHVLTMFVFSAGVPDFSTMSLIAIQHANLIGLLLSVPEELKQRIIFRATQLTQAISLELAAYNAEVPDTDTIDKFNALYAEYSRSCAALVPFVEQITPVMQQTAANLSNVTVENIDQREIQEQIRQEMNNIPTILTQPGGVFDNDTGQGNNRHDDNAEQGGEGKPRGQL